MRKLKQWLEENGEEEFVRKMNQCEIALWQRVVFEGPEAFHAFVREVMFSWFWKGMICGTVIVAVLFVAMRALS